MVIAPPTSHILSSFLTNCSFATKTTSLHHLQVEDGKLIIVQEGSIQKFKKKHLGPNWLENPLQNGVMEV
jgi:hypothetical protein